MRVGFNCKEKCHLCMGQDMGYTRLMLVPAALWTCQDWDNTSLDAQWRTSMPRTTSPFNAVPLPLMGVPGISRAEDAFPDSAHVFHIKGIGQDFAASCVVLLAKLGTWPGRSLDAKLSNGYKAFREWCHTEKKTTSIDAFSKLTFDMSSHLVSSVSRECQYELVGHAFCMLYVSI